jgi:hypothetical protein
MLSAVCCLLSAACCLLSAACCLLSVVCCLLPAVCCLPSAACCLLTHTHTLTGVLGDGCDAWQLYQRVVRLFLPLPSPSLSPSPSPHGVRDYQTMEELTRIYEHEVRHHHRYSLTPYAFIFQDHNHIFLCITSITTTLIITTTTIITIIIIIIIIIIICKLGVAALAFSPDGSQLLTLCAICYNSAVPHCNTTVTQV